MAKAGHFETLRPITIAPGGNGTGFGGSFDGE